MPHLSQTLRYHRTSQGLRQSDLADRADISAAYLSQIESGQKRPSMAVLERLASALEVSPAELLHTSVSTRVDPPRETGLAVGGASRQQADGAARQPGSVATYTMTRREDIEQALRSHMACHAIAHRAEDVLDSGFGARLEEHAEIGRRFAWVLHDFASGRYRAIAWDSLMLIAAALLYLTEPDDFLPADSEHGHLDDIAILRFTESLVDADMAAYMTWRGSHEQD